MSAWDRARLGRLHAALAPYVERGNVPSLVALVHRRGEVHVEAIGARSLGGPAVTRDSIFRIASMSKPVAAAATMALVEECKLHLDEPVERLLPELANRVVLKRVDGPLDETVPARRAITVRDCLAFTTGFGLVMAPPGSTPIQRACIERGIMQGPPEIQRPPAPDAWMRGLGELPLMAQPGERWLYNTGSDVLSVLCARASGQPFDALLRERLFEPLGMNDTGFFVPASKLDRFVTAYSTDPRTGGIRESDAAAGGDWSKPPAFPSGSGGLVSTADDFLAFARMLSGGGVYDGKRVLTRASIEMMTADQLTPEQKAISWLLPGTFDAHGWGFGMLVTTRRAHLGDNVGCFGWNGGLGTSWQSDPKEELDGILLTQASFTSPEQPPVVRDFWTTTYQALG